MLLAAFFRSPSIRAQLIYAALVLNAAVATAQPLDPDFNPSANSDVFAIAAQPDGKILAGGNFSSLGGVARSRLARVNVDGGIDSTFNPGPNTTVNAVAVQPDGRIVVGGAFESIAGVSRVRLARLLATGAIDSTFSAGADGSVSSIAVQSDGRILLGGSFSVVNSTSRTLLARVNADGSLDTTFNPIATSVSTFQLRVATIVVQSDAKILIGGTFTHINGVSTPGIARLHVDGSLDNTFSVGSGANAIEAIALQPDGKILIGGSFLTFAGLPRRYLARLSPTGAPDDQVGLIGPGSSVRCILLQPDGKIVVGGFFGSVGSVARSRLARFDADGALDAGFDFDVAGANGGSAPGVYAMASPASGLIVFGGTFSSVSSLPRHGIARIGLPPPSIATSPRAQSVATGQVVSLSVGASGSNLSYQWLRNGVALSGATGATLSLPRPTTADSGSYSVVVTNPVGSVTSAAAVLTVDPKSVYIVQQPASRTVASGTDVTLNATAVGQPAVAYQWFKDGQPLAGATTGSLALGWAVPDHTGAYAVVAIDPSGSVTSTAAVLTVTGGIPYLVSTLAGSLRTSGSTDGAGAEARFNNLGDVAVDAAGYLYVSDRVAHTIRKISPTGVVTTFAGRAGVSGVTNASGPNASFNAPAGLVVDRTGNVFVADTNNNRIRKITPSGVVTTLVGQAQGSVDGVAAVAQLYLPFGLASDADGNLYCSEGGAGGNTIRKITPAGTVTTLAGLARATGSADGKGADARFNGPGGLAVDAAGNVYVADSGNSSIRRITPAGEVTTFAGQPGAPGSLDGTGGGARFLSPSRLTIDPAGNLFVSSGTTIRSITPDGVVTTPIGAVAASSHLDGLGASARFSTLAGLTSDAQGSLYICDSSNSLLRKATLLGRKGARVANLSVRSLAGTGGDTLIVGFNIPSGSKTLLLRAVGPALAALGVTGALADPTVQLEGGGTVVAQNNDWDSPVIQGVALSEAAARVGAFSLPAQSKDAALLQSLGAGSYTAQVGGGNGVALVEIYDASIGGSATAGRLGNVSARTRAGTGADTLIVGFVLGGDTARTVLIRGIGPTLGVFGVTGALANPRLELYRDALLVDTNTAWGGAAALASAFSQVGAFPLASDSRDSALLVTLLPGAYTAQLTGANNTTGIALVEIYDVP